MLLSMFGMGGTEMLVILIVALLFLGPDKLPEAAKTISKGIRDLKKQSRALQQQIENDEHIGGAIRDLKSALRGEEAPVRPPVRKLEEPPAPAPAPTPTLPEAVGEADPDVKDESKPDELASMIKPVEGSVAKTEKHG